MKQNIYHLSGVFILLLLSNVLYGFSSYSRAINSEVQRTDSIVDTTSSVIYYDYHINGDGEDGDDSQTYNRYWIDLSKIDYFIPLREEYYKNMNTNSHFFDIGLLAEAGLRTLYVADTLRINNYNVLEDSNNVKYIIIDKKILDNDFNYTNPLKNKNCFLTNQSDDIFFYGCDWEYYLWPLMCINDYWLRKPIKSVGLKNGYTISDACQTPKHEHIDLFAVCFIRGDLYKEINFYKMSPQTKKMYDFIDNDTYYIMLVPISDFLYRNNFERIIWDYRIEPDR